MVTIQTATDEIQQVKLNHYSRHHVLEHKNDRCNRFAQENFQPRWKFQYYWCSASV